MREWVCAHGQPADRVELDAVLRRELSDRTADDLQPLAGVDGVLAVDVVVAELAARQLERLLAPLVAAGADQIEGGLPQLGAIGHAPILARRANSTVAERKSSYESIGAA